MQRASPPSPAPRRNVAHNIAYKLFRNLNRDVVNRLQKARLGHHERFAESGATKGVIEPRRVGNMLVFLSAAGSFDELGVPPNFGFHELTGDRAGTYAMTVTRNWRLTFTKIDDQTIANLDLEDYH